jgi:hypothetical protein
MHELQDGDVITCIAGTFRISGRRVSYIHRPNQGWNESKQAYDFTGETPTDCLVFDGIAIDPEQQHQTWTLQGNDHRMVTRHGKTQRPECTCDDMQLKWVGCDCDHVHG